MPVLGPILETIIGGLMSGMLYSLVALGFVLIYKASGVFNFAQGAMVLFAALAMARFSEWIPQWTGLESKFINNALAFAAALAIMVVVAWLIEKLVLGKLVNQEGVALLMATLGISYFLDGSARPSSAPASTRSTWACPRTRCSCWTASSRAACW